MAALLQEVSLSFSMVPWRKEFCTHITSMAPDSGDWAAQELWVPGPKWKKKPGEALLPKSDVPHRVRARNSVFAVTGAPGCVRSPIWSAFSRLVVSTQGNSAKPLQVCNCKILPENGKPIYCSLLWQLICQYSVVSTQARPPLSQLSLSWKNRTFSPFLKVERSKPDL